MVVIYQYHEHCCFVIGVNVNVIIVWFLLLEVSLFCISVISASNMVMLLRCIE